ncbi:MAG: S41 family peptidase [Anaerolineales bacterium]
MTRLLRYLITAVFMVITGVVLLAGGFIAGRLSATQGLVIPGLTGPSAAQTGTPADLAQTFAPFWQAWTIVHQEYVDQPVKDIDLMQGAIRGMMGALGDSHTLYESPSESQISDTSLSGELEGIGATVDPDPNGLVIVSPLPSSPAEGAGLLPNDLIIQVDGKDLAGMNYYDAIALVRGPANSKVHLTVVRAGVDKPLEFDLVRAKITIPSVESKLLTGQIGYIKINTFGQQTPSELRAALNTLLKQNPSGLVLDLRNDPGGYLDTAIDVASQFLPTGTVVMREKYGDGHEDVFNAKSGGLATDIPMVVLVNKGSASASEILAGAIQDNQRGVIIGETSYGKGTVQQIHPLQQDAGVIRVTIARWLTPTGRSIDKVGITPNTTVAMTAEDVAAKRDPQLDKALSVLGQPGGSLPAPRLLQLAQ